MPVMASRNTPVEAKFTLVPAACHGFPDRPFPAGRLRGAHKVIIDPPAWNRPCTDFVGIVFELERMRTVTGPIGRSIMRIAVLSVFT